jgi:uncharacterized protein YecE (DUF72 family)
LHDAVIFRIGTSGYSYPGPPPKGWFGAFYPQSKGKRFDALEYYSRYFDVVEINSSFYGPPTPAMAEGWVKKTSPGFEFAVKLWQKFTHPSKIGQGNARGGWEAITQDDIDLCRKGFQPLAESGKLAALLLQYPASFDASPENTDKLSDTLKAFADYPLAVELRHRSWSDNPESTKQILEERRATLALIDEPKFQSSIRQSTDSIGDMLYFRAHGRNAAMWWDNKESWERYDYCYSWEEIKKIADKIKTATIMRPEIRKALVFFNNHARGQSAVNALMLSHAMGLPVKNAPNEALTQAFPQISEIIPRTPKDTLF